MPYVDQSKRARWAGTVEQVREDMFDAPTTEGELNYLITCVVDGWIESQAGVSYKNLNAAIGVLECAKQELYRRVAAPYEDDKCEYNGDVYLTTDWMI